MKKVLSVLLTLILCFSMCSCTFIENIYNGLYSDATKAEMDVADKFAQKFFSLISIGNILEAEEYMHPQFFKDEGSLVDYLSNIEKNENIDFSQGVKIERTISKNKSSDYFFHNGYTYDGYTIKYDILIGNISKTCKISVCNNDDGYGIYQIIFVK